jgi:hypothetical protein
MRSFILTICAFVAVVVVIGCERETAPQAASAQPAAESLPADLFATTQPAGAVDIVTARRSAKDGEPIVVMGRVGGQKEPVGANRAIVTLADLSLPTCDKATMKTCETPWDSCCEPKEEIAAKTISVRVVGADGKPIKTGLGAAGIAPNKHLVVAGTARTGAAGGETLVVDANQIYVMP